MRSLDKKYVFRLTNTISKDDTQHCVAAVSDLDSLVV